MSKISIDKDSLVGVLKELEFVVVSLDRIGSAELSANDRSDAVYRFVVEGNVFRRLSSIRRLMAITLDEGVTPAERDLIDDAFKNISPWDYKLAS
jgi:hypothetical protein